MLDSAICVIDKALSHLLSALNWFLVRVDGDFEGLSELATAWHDIIWGLAVFTGTIRMFSFPLKASQFPA